MVFRNLDDIPPERRDPCAQVELAEAGIPAFQSLSLGDERITSDVSGRVGNWKFDRHTCYWAATTEEGCGFSLGLANLLNTLHASSIRAGGYCLGLRHIKPDHFGVSPQGTVDLYHISDDEGLRAFVTFAEANG